MESEITQVPATTYFLQSFMDNTASNRQCSQVSDQIDEMRNVMVHQLFSSRTHAPAFDCARAEGWRRDQALPRINLDVFAEQFIAAVDGGRLWQLKLRRPRTTGPAEIPVRPWTGLTSQRRTPFGEAVDHLATLTTIEDIESAAALVNALSAQRCSL